MTPLEEILMIIGMMMVTFGVRYPVLFLSGRISMPPAIEHALSFVPVAVLTAISVPIMFKPAGTWDLTLGNEYLIAGVASIVIAALSRKLLLTIGLGMALFLALRFLA
jgi:branched-subunit amino acid transport protein